jgi:hypothetical protein
MNRKETAWGMRTGFVRVRICTMADSCKHSNEPFWFYKWGHVVALWLRYYATSQKVMGLRPDEVKEFCHVIFQLN